MVPRMVSRALSGTSGITSLMGDGGASGCSRTAGSTSADFVSTVSVAGCGSGSSLTTGAAAVGTGTGSDVESFLNMLMPTQLSTIATAPAISSSTLVLRRHQAGGGGGPPGTIFTRITSRVVDGVPDWDSAVATEVACDSIDFTTAVRGIEDLQTAPR